MIGDLLQLFVISIFISLATFGGGSQALFYQYGVLQNHWISNTDLSAILALGYATPGPAVFGTATFIGYQIAGVPGALIGTVGIFVVPFTLALIASRYLSDLLNKPAAESFIQGIGLAAAGLVAATAFGVVHGPSVSLWQVFIFAVALVVSVRWKVNPLYVVLVGGALGFLI